MKELLWFSLLCILAMLTLLAVAESNHDPEDALEEDAETRIHIDHLADRSRRKQRQGQKNARGRYSMNGISGKAVRKA